MTLALDLLKIGGVLSRINCANKGILYEEVEKGSMLSKPLKVALC